MASQEAIDLAAKALTASSSAYGTYLQGRNGQLVGFLASQIDAAVDLVKQAGGIVSPKMLAITLAKKGLAIGGMAVDPDNQLGQCMFSLAQISLSLAALAASGPVGLAGLAANALSLLADAYAVEDNCKQPAQDAYKSMDDALSRFSARFGYEFMQWVEQTSGMDVSQAFGQ